MKKPRINRNAILDKLHRGVVYTCIGVTILGTAFLGHRVYQYFTVIRPMRKQEERKMLEEGSHDKAPELKY